MNLTLNALISRTKIEIRGQFSHERRGTSALHNQPHHADSSKTDSDGSSVHLFAQWTSPCFADRNRSGGSGWLVFLKK
jgi:hypothetical protein